ncbi:MAG: ATP-binding protein [Bacteroidia bacterium]|nr:ATP-binding protein [Bacteroidia bacterium]
MSDSRIIMDLIKRGEDESLDFKKHITSAPKIAKTIVAFANTKGGDIIVGVDDFGEIHGIDVQQEKYMLIKAAKDHCIPPIYLYFDSLIDKKDEILIVHVRKSKERHSVLNEDGDLLPYIRVKDQSILAPDAELSDKGGGAIQIFSETDKSYLVQYLKENQYITIQEYMKMMRLSYPVAKKSIEHLMDSGVLKEEHVSNKLRYSLA